ncbi:rhamnan synthesis F family protein [Tabrizicola sp.]|uniref:rhamnan synthesis F family protein n=1 Tax=Tabrizicola sp. TaxID=2005166 RepID=UPI003F4005E3
MAGVLGEMGCDLPADLMPPIEMNAKGFFESNKITYLNEDVLVSAGMAWFDLKRFPETWYASTAATEFRKLASATFVEEFATSNLCVIKDPRHCRLVPFWEEVLTEQGVQPVYVCIHRNPVEVAASLMRWHGHEPLYGQYLWLRHVLDAEIATRGKKRVFVSYDQLLSDWRSLVSRISSTLDVVFPRSVPTAASDVERFVSADLKHLSSESLTIPRLENTSDWLASTLGILTRWSRTGEESSDHAVLDRTRDAMDVASGTVVTVLDELLACHREVASVRQEVEESFRDDVERLSAQLAEAYTALANGETKMRAVMHSMHEASLRSQALENDLNDRIHDLRKARNRPLSNLGKFIEFKALRMLSSDGSPLPRRAKSRFGRSAKKRDPNRDLPPIQTGAVAKSSNGADLLSEQGQVPFRPELPSAIIVTHDASRTGAPILAYNMAKALSSRYNTFVVCMRAGDLVADFLQVSTKLYEVGHESGIGPNFLKIVDAIVAQTTPAFAVVNSIESRHILGALRLRKIPSVALLHEFASYTLPTGAFTEALCEADEVVFSSELTIRNALDQTSFVRTSRFHVLPQGRCEVPRHDSNEVLLRAERDNLTTRLRPGGGNAGEFLVIGAGYVQLRKGVDLFIDVARRVLSTSEGRNARFAWIGAGYDPERDAGYSVYLKDQIERAGLTDRMLMIGETSEIEHAYALSDVLLLTSRLDPLPNVAIDALSEGLPVVCFDKTTGIADLLTNGGLRDACVADYLDTWQAAEKVLRFIRSPEAYRQVTEASKAFAARTFDFNAYAARIEALGLHVNNASSRLAEDTATIGEADSIDAAFMLPRWLQASGKTGASHKTEAVKYYLNDNQRQAAPRRPEAGFNALVYARHLEAEGVTDVDAYAEFLRRGRPAGPWLRSVIRETAKSALPEGKTPLKTALHIHAYYPDVVASIAERLALNETQPDLFVNAGDRKSLDAAVEMLSGYRGRIVAARVVVNRGRDIGPLLTEFGGELLRDYDLIGHVHTKKSVLLSDRDVVERWVNFLYENMIGGRDGGPMMDRILAAFAQNERLGIAFPSDPNTMAWSANEDLARGLAPRLRLDGLPEFIDFPIGSMFWIRAAALQPFVDLGLGWHDYPPEPVGSDGTVLHAIERLFGVVAESRGLEVAVTNVKGVAR